MQQQEFEFKRRILMMYITKVSGHRQATIAIQQALRKIDPSLEAPMVNGFGYTYPILEKVVNQAYMSVIHATPAVWDYIYDNPKIVKNSESIKNFLHKTSHDKIAKLFERYRPDTVVCTQAFPCGMVADYKTEHHLETKLIGVLTDFAPHSYWINKGVDYYIVPSIDTKERFIKKGVDADKIKVYGIPVRSKFAVQLDKHPIAASLGFEMHVPTILIMGGGQGLGPMKHIVASLSKMSIDCQIIVLAGTNKRAVEQLQRLAKRIRQRIFIQEFATNVDEYMELADIIITKPGGITTAECLAKGLPMVIVNALPGQERRNTDFLIKNGIAIRIDDTNDIGEEVEILLRSPEKLSAMSQAAYANARPHATDDIARLILGEPREELTVPLEESEVRDQYV
jgi:processive 1,2-diacylglycerol beta-glucosyltransferase